MTKVRVSINIDDGQLKWIREQIKKGEFDNQSSAVRKCIMITKRVFEKANPDELAKFVHGKS
jgi:Arc/MetJ-type ribon-helix-helix transcriptional regulator